MQQTTLYAVAIIVVVMIIIWSLKDMKKYADRPGVDYTNGATDDKNLAPGVTYIGTAETAADCRRMAKGYDAYTFRAGKCYGINFGKPDAGSASGLRPVYGGFHEKIGTYTGVLDRKLATPPAAEKFIQDYAVRVEGMSFKRANDDVEPVVKHQSAMLARAPRRVERMTSIPSKKLSRKLNDDTYPLALNRGMM